MSTSFENQMIDLETFTRNLHRMEGITFQYFFGTERAIKLLKKTMSEIDQMKLDMVTKLASLLMEEQPELTMEQALSIVLNSDTYQRLLEDNTTLYYQSPRYVFSFLQTELQTGKVG